MNLAQSGLEQSNRFGRENCFIELGPRLSQNGPFYTTPFYATTNFTLYLLKRKKHISHLYAFRKEQHIKNHFQYHCHNTESILNQYLLQEYKYNDFFRRNDILLLNVVRFFFLNIFNLANIYLSSRIGLAANSNFKSLLTTFHISLYFS